MIKKILDIRFDQQFIKPYIQRIKQDAGAWRNETATKQFQKLCKDYNMLDSIRFAWLGESGYKQRTSGINTFWTKLYSLVGTNDATQTTSTSQPYLAGNIAPNEKWCLKNPNGGANNMTHPAISFAANEPWSVTTVLNNTFNSFNHYYIGGVGATSLLGLRHPDGVYRFFNSLGNANSFGVNTGLPDIGKNAIITVVANGLGGISLYINGVIKYTTSNFGIQTSFVFARIFYNITGSISSHIIRAQALTPTQVAAEANFLRSLYPEIPSVTIGSQVWATSNCEMVASSNGTLIADGNIQATWASDAAAYWCHHTDIATGAVYGKLYNKKGRDVLIANPPPGWHAATKAELTALAANGGNALKKDGTTYWTTTGGTNTTGFTAIGGAKRNADGTFATIKNTATFWCADSDEVLLLNHNDNTATIVATTSAQGHSIRLVKD